MVCVTDWVWTSPLTIYSDGQNIFRFFHDLGEFLFTSSEIELDSPQESECTGISGRKLFHELSNNLKLNKLDQEIIKFQEDP